MASKKILIVEDDMQLQSALKDKFSIEGFVAIVASDGQEGLQMAKDEKPDLVLVDILLPKVDGITMAKAIKNLKPTPLMMFLTNVSDIEHIAEASDAAYSDYLVKSDWNLDDIVKKVKEKLEAN